MKKVIFTLAFFVSATAAFATASTKSISKNLKFDCTKTATVTSSAEVECPDGSIITISVTTTRSATAQDCDEASTVAYISASVVSSSAVEGNVKAKNYICP